MKNASAAHKLSSLERGPFQISLTYALVGGLWILLTTLLLHGLLDDREGVIRLHVIGASFFVATTAGLLYWLIRRGMAAFRSSIARDITERKQGEEELRNSEARGRAILESAFDCVISMDHEGKITEFNPAAEKTFGYTRAEVIGREMAELIIPPSLRPQHRRGMAHYLATGEGPLLGKRIEITALRADGSEFPVELAITPIHLGQHPLFTASVRDITKHRQVGEAEREQRALAEALRDTAAALNSTLHLDEVLDRILANVGRVVPHDSVSIMLIESGVAHIVRRRGYAERGLEASVLAVRFTVADVPSLRQMVDAGQPLAIPDTHAFLGWVDLPETRWVRSYASAPIRVKGEVIGFLNLNSATPGFFTPTHAERLLAFADQAAIAIENAQLFEAAQRRLDEQAALLAASTAISSSLDLATVLNRLAEQMVQTIDVTSAYICDWNPESGTATVLAEYWGLEASPQERESDLGATYHLAEDFGDDLGKWLWVGKTFISHVDDPSLHEVARAHLLRYGGRSALTVPLVIKGMSIGYADLWESRRRRDFTSEEIALCVGIAQQAAIAFENARLFAAARQRAERMTVLNEIGQALASTLGLDQLYKVIYQQSRRVLAVDAFYIGLYDEERNAIHFPFNYDEGEYLLPQTLPMGEGPTSHVIRTKASFRVNRPGDPIQHGGTPFGYTDRRSASALHVPMLAGERVTGVISAQSYRENAYSAEDLQMLEVIASQAAVAIENARLYEAISRHAAELEQRVSERTTELESERRRMETILNGAAEGITLTDLNQIMKYVNPALERVSGYTAAELLGQTPRLMRSGLTPRTVYESMKRAFVHGEVWEGEVINRRKDGTLYDAALTITPLKNADDQIVGFVGSQHDITRLKELDRLKDMFVTNVGHELRTPLANVKLYLHLLEHGKPDKRDQYMQTLHRETARLQNLVEAMLDLSQLDLGAISVEAIPIDLNRLMADLVADRSAMIAGQGLVLAYRPDPDLPPALIDPTLTVQAMANLMANAVNYTPRGGTVTLSTALRQREDREWVTFTVRDTGPGLSLEDQSHLFERFYRGEAGRHTSAPGTGLGLAICKEMVNKMGGDITVESQPGHGAAFTVWLRPVREGA